MMMLVVGVGQAQNAFTGVHKYDGEHKNEFTGYAVFGGNVVVGAFGALEASYKRHFTDRWHAGPTFRRSLASTSTRST